MTFSDGAVIWYLQRLKKHEGSWTDSITNPQIRRSVFSSALFTNTVSVSFKFTVLVLGAKKDEFRKDRPLQAVLQPYKSNWLRFIFAISASGFPECLVVMHGAWIPGTRGRAALAATLSSRSSSLHLPCKCSALLQIPSTKKNTINNHM